MLQAGAWAEQDAAAKLVRPTSCSDIIGALPEAAARYGITSLRSIIGAAHR